MSLYRHSPVFQLHCSRGSWGPPHLGLFLLCPRTQSWTFHQIWYCVSSLPKWSPPRAAAAGFSGRSRRYSVLPWRTLSSRRASHRLQILHKCRPFPCFLKTKRREVKRISKSSKTRLIRTLSAGVTCVQCLAKRARSHACNIPQCVTVSCRFAGWARN